MRNQRFALVGLIAALVGCGGGSETDAGPDMTDAGPGMTDAGPGMTDAGPDMTDAGPDMTDAGPDMTDAGPGMMDAGGACALSVEGSISVPETIMGRLSGTGENASTTCTSDTGAGGPDHIYTLNIASTMGVELTATATFGVALSIRTACDDAIGELGCARTDMGGAPDTAQLRGVLEPGVYYVLVDTLGFGVGGDYTLTAAEVTAPPHTTCAAAMTVAPDTVLPSEDLGLAAMAASTCGGMPANSLFYSVEIPAGSGLAVSARSVAPLPTPATVEILDGCTDSMCLTDSGMYPNTSGAAQTVIVAVRGTGQQEVSFELFRVAENASCATALSVADGTTLTGERLSFGGPNPDECHASLGTDGSHRSLFYTVDVPAGELLRVRATPFPEFEPVLLSLLDGCGAGAACAASAGVHPRMPGTEGAQEVFFENTGAASTTLVLAVSGPDIASYDLSIVIGPPPTNTSCAMATPVVDGTSLPIEYVGTATDTLEASCLPGATSPVVYYSATLGVGETLSVGATVEGFAIDSASVRVLSACGAATCLASGTNAVRYDNTSGSSENVIIAVGIEPDPTPPPGVTPRTSFGLSVSIGVPPYVETSITASCNDMSAGTPVAAVTADDSVSATTALPFAFDFFGGAATHHSVNSNGVMQLFSSASGAGARTFVNAPIPSADTPNGYIAAFWDDLVPGSVVTTTTGTTPNQVYTVQWTAFSRFADRSAALTFQTQLYETSNVIELHYCTMTPGMDMPGATGASATVGLENAAGSLGIQHSFDTPDSVDTVNGIRFTPM